ncbi:MAG: HlyC/CorC family transporter [Chitinophagaceae bacterium]|nr:MAG: HlyC/CorC family transporter [Chitinophagaceae bacterium]
MLDLRTIIWFVLTILLMGFFSGIEMAFYSANRLGIELKKKQGRASGQILDQFVDHPVHFLGTTLIGFNIFLVFFGLQISNVMRPLWDLLSVKSDTIRILVEIGISTFVVLLFAEFIPRAIFRARANNWLTRLAHLIDIFYQMFYPIAAIFISMSEWLLKYLFNIRVDEKKDAFGRSDLEHLFRQTRETEEDNQPLNAELFENALELPKVKIRQCLVPRKEIVGIDITASVDSLKKAFIETKLTRLVIFESNIDHIVGYVHQLDLFKQPAVIQSVLLPIPAVPESMSATDLISKFTKERKSIAWVVDEFGGTAGIITMEDVLEEIFGEIHDEYDVEEFVEKQIAENEYIFSGRLELDYLNEKYGFDLPVDETETLSGFIINYHETIPRQKERIIITDFEFDVMNVSDTRIEMVKMKKLK